MCRTVTVDMGDLVFVEIPGLNVNTRVVDVIQELWRRNVNMHKKRLAKSDEDTPVSLVQTKLYHYFNILVYVHAPALR